MGKKQDAFKEALEDFLYNQLSHNEAYREWAGTYELPRCITDNLSRELRDYQVDAVKRFIWLFENYPNKAHHLLFNMATGTGKTLTMSAIALYLFTRGYRNFVFLVHQIQIKEQTEECFTDYKFEKYLFNPRGVRIDGRRIEVRASHSFVDDYDRTGINFIFLSTQLLFDRLKAERENSITIEDFQKHKTVILADEAHRLNVDTRKKLTKTEHKDVTNWETAVRDAVNANPDNLLLEFTATVDLENKNIRDKYREHIVFRYDFAEFNRDQYSKEVKYLYNEATQAAKQKRYLIVNAVALSEYRKLLAENDMGLAINPIILVKSKTIKQSEKDRQFFNDVIQSLEPKDFRPLHEQAIRERSQDPDNVNQSYTLSQMFSWIALAKNHLVTASDPSGVKKFIERIREDFSLDHTLVYNSKEKDNAQRLLTLDNPRNTIRVIFSVNALNEGWDVLGLYDIIHFDISENKKVSLQDIQLIGRGARLYPYELPKSYHEKDFFSQDYDTDPYKRKFDRFPNAHGRILERMYYHFVKTGNFLNDLQMRLMGEGIVARGTIKRTFHLKPEFMKSATYQKGFVLANRQEYRKNTPHTKEEIDYAFNRTIEVRPYRLLSSLLTDKLSNKTQGVLKFATIRLTPEYFSRELIRKALVSYGSFFYFNEITRHITNLTSIDGLIDDLLPRFKIQYEYEPSKSIYALTPEEKLHLLVNSILPEVRKVVDVTLPITTGSREFYPVKLREIFSTVKDIWIVEGKEGESFDERAKGQIDNPNEELREDLSIDDWYANTENYGTSEEKLFVKYVKTQIEELRERFRGCEIYLLRNELEYSVFRIKDGRRFSPDYLMFINDWKNKKTYYQCLFEVKGDHLYEKDKWKQKALLEFTKGATVSFSENTEWKPSGSFIADQEFADLVRSEHYSDIKCLGFKFFNAKRKAEFQENLNKTLGF